MYDVQDVGRVQSEVNKMVTLVSSLAQGDDPIDGNPVLPSKPYPLQMGS